MLAGAQRADMPGSREVSLLIWRLLSARPSRITMRGTLVVLGCGPCFCVMNFASASRRASPHCPFWRWQRLPRFWKRSRIVFPGCPDARISSGFRKPFPIQIGFDAPPVPNDSVSVASPRRSGLRDRRDRVSKCAPQAALCIDCSAEPMSRLANVADAEVKRDCPRLGCDSPPMAI
jgi:hypothetical protein